MINEVIFMAYVQEYWLEKQKRAKRAQIHTASMQRKYPDQIQNSISKTVIYTEEMVNAFPVKKKEKTRIETIDTDTVSAVLDNVGNGKICVLNFASFKNPGGMFMAGSRAQEECLCHESFLYNVLSEFEKSYYEKNKKVLNRSLYINRSLYSPNILFHRKDRADVFADVITCAAPNKSAAQKYCNVSDFENKMVLRSRIDFVLHQAAINNARVLILGAYGCGVFGQNPQEVFEIFKTLLNTKYFGCFLKVVFAVPDSNTNTNYKVAKSIFSD